jgi:hypothetical protein
MRRMRLRIQGLGRAARRPDLLAVCALSGLMAAAYGIFLPNLLDRDESSFYHTVRWYEVHTSMPVLGHVGVSYEAQHGPVYFVPAAAVDSLFRPLGPDVAFHAVRALGFPLLIVIVILAYLLAARLSPGSETVPLLTACLVGLNPHLLALSGSVSNDLLGIAVAMGAVYLFTVRLQDGTLSVRPALIVGLLIGLSVVTKASAFSLLVALPVAALALRRRAAVMPSLLIAAGTAAASGWWFIRNEVTYGDFFGINGLRRWGWPVHPGSLTTLHQIASRASYFAISYASPQPTFGGSFRTPLAAKIVFAAIALAAIVGILRYALQHGTRRIGLDSTALVTFVLVLVTSIGANVYSYVTVLILDPRTTFTSFFVLACAAALGLGELIGRVTPRLLAILVGVALLVANAVILSAAAKIPRPPIAAGSGLASYDHR